MAVEESVRDGKKNLTGSAAAVATPHRQRVVRKKATKNLLPELHSRCLLCGDKNPLSLGLRFEPSGEDVVQTELLLHRRLQGYDGILHGGVISSLLDAAMTHCLFHAGIAAVTGDLHVRFLHPVPCEEKVAIRSWVLSAFPPLYSVRAELLVEGRVMAWGVGKFAQRRKNS